MFEVGHKVLVLGSTSGRYEGATGVVTAVTTGGLVHVCIDGRINETFWYEDLEELDTEEIS